MGQTNSRSSPRRPEGHDQHVKSFRTQKTLPLSPGVQRTDSLWYILSEQEERNLFTATPIRAHPHRVDPSFLTQHVKDRLTERCKVIGHQKYGRLSLQTHGQLELCSNCSKGNALRLTEDKGSEAPPINQELANEALNMLFTVSKYSDTDTQPPSDVALRSWQPMTIAISPDVSPIEEGTTSNHASAGFWMDSDISDVEDVESHTTRGHPYLSTSTLALAVGPRKINHSAMSRRKSSQQTTRRPTSVASASRSKQALNSQPPLLDTTRMSHLDTLKSPTTADFRENFQEYLGEANEPVTTTHILPSLQSISEQITHSLSTITDTVDDPILSLHKRSFSASTGITFLSPKQLTNPSPIARRAPSVRRRNRPTSTRRSSITSLRSTNSTHTSKRPLQCTVCDETKLRREFNLPTQKCKHAAKTCKDCVSQWIAASLERNGVQRLRCPDCRLELKHADVKRCADASVFERYDLFTIRDLLNSTPNFHWCLSPICSSGQIHDSESSGPLFRCGACGFQSCLTHGAAWHVGETCAQFDDRTDVKKQRRRQLEEERRNRGWVEARTKKCPGEGCQWRIEKSEGCDHMTCSQCKYQFCWICLADYKQIVKKGNHYHKHTCRYYCAVR